MNYILKQYDIELLRFNMQTTNDGLQVTINYINKEKKYLLPIGMEANNGSLLRWLKGRTIPRNRAYVSNFLARLGLNEKDVQGILDICQGLSLNDAYWVVKEDCKDIFKERNLYENPFNTNIASIAFTGYGSFERTTFHTSPEFTTNGMLAKSWRRIDNKIILFKAGSEGFANSGVEPYSEYYASQVAEVMGIAYVPYGLSRWKGKMCSTCELFNDINTSFVATGKIIKSGGIDSVINYYINLGESYYQELLDMLVFDAIILNEDRHLGNFGFLVDNKTNEIIKTAPVYDNGLSLLYGAMKEDFKEINKYANTRRPALYMDFIQFVKPLITNRQKERIRKLVQFEFNKQHRKYKLPNWRLRKLEIVIQERARELL